MSRKNMRSSNDFQKEHSPLNRTIDFDDVEGDSDSDDEVSISPKQQSLYPKLLAEDLVPGFSNKDNFYEENMVIKETDEDGNICQTIIRQRHFSGDSKNSSKTKEHSLDCSKFSPTQKKAQISTTNSQFSGDNIPSFFSQNWTFNPKTVLILLLLPLLLSIFYAFTKQNPDCSSSRLQQKHRDYNLEANSIVRNSFNNSLKVRSLFRYAGEVLFNEDRKLHGGPVVILVSGTPKTTAQFFDHLRGLLEKYYLTESLMDYEIVAGKSPSRLEFETVLFEHLRTHNKKILLLRGVDNLHETSPLVLHSLADPESSPFKNSFIVASINPLRNGEGGYKNCEENVLNHIIDKWSSELTIDKIYPIYSRISSLLQCI